MSNYSKKVKKSMKYLASKKNTIFLGQSVIFPGNLILKTLDHIDNKKKLELPVFEEVQMGMSLGMALNGLYPITCFPRFDFLLCAMNQLVNHTDKVEALTKGQFPCGMIIRVLVGAKEPLDGGVQHTQNYSEDIKNFFTSIKVYNLDNEKNIFDVYKQAYKNKKINLIIEHSEKY